MRNIPVTVRNKIAAVQGVSELVCGNSDYTVTFDLDSEWAPYDAKTAQFRFLENGVPRCYEVLFTGNTVNVPPVYGTAELLVGVYAGNIRTSTAAVIPCLPCIAEGTVPHPAPPPDVCTQLIALLRRMKSGGAVSGEAYDLANAVCCDCTAGNAEELEAVYDL